MKVILFANTDWYLYNFRLNLAQALRARDAEVVLLSPSGPYASQLQAAGFRWIPTPMSGKGMNPFEELKTVWLLRKIYRNEKPDLVHHFTIKCVLYGSMVARWSKVRPVVNAVPGLGYVFNATGWRGALMRLLVRWLYRFALRDTQVIFQNKEDREIFIRLHLVRAESTHLIPGSGVNLNKFSPMPEPSGIPVVMLAARMLWDKGVGDFVEAARILKSDNVQARFVLVGDTYADNPSAVPPQQLTKWSKEGIVEWWGWQEDMERILPQSSLVCLPTYHEGAPRILIEAAASGRAIVSTNIAGCREIVHEGINGLTVPSRNPVMLAQALRTLISDPNERLRMGSEGRKIAENHFSDELIAMKTLEVYKSYGFFSAPETI
jgi:glycosyltransferase involved in cell wall biosynthesis